MFDWLWDALKLLLHAWAWSLFLIAASALFFYSGAGVAMVFGLLKGNPWSTFFLVRLGFWSAVFVAAFALRRATL